MMLTEVLELEVVETGGKWQVKTENERTLPYARPRAGRTFGKGGWQH